MQTIAVIEDDRAIRCGVVDSLRFAGYETLEAGTWKDGFDLALRANFQLLLLDLVLPGGSGFDILRTLEEARPGIPVIILTACGEETDRVMGLKLGADDYVVKPFSMKELLARVEAVLRRSPERSIGEDVVPFQGGKADLKRSELTFENGARVALSDREASLIAYLAQHRGRAISREEILRRVWQIDSAAVETRTIDMHIANLRTKLRQGDDTSELLLTVRGKGYMLTEGHSK